MLRIVKIFLTGATISLFSSSCYEKSNTLNNGSVVLVNGYSKVSEIQTENLVAYWSFDGNFIDSVSLTAGTGVNVSFGEGYVGQALQGDVNGYAVADISDAVKNLNSFTIMFWTYYPKTTATFNNWVDIISINGSNYDWNNEAQTGSWDFYKLGNSGGWGTHLDNSEPTSFGCHVRNINQVTNYWDKSAWLGNLWTNNVFDNWVGWTFTYDASTSAFNIYKNGSQWVSDGWVGDNVYPKTNFWSLGDLKFDNPTKIIFGANTPNGPSGSMWGSQLAAYDGKLDEVRIYKTELTHFEISTIVELQTMGKL